MSVQISAVSNTDALTAIFNYERSPIRHFHNPDTETNAHREVLMLAVKQGLSVLGESVAQVIFYNMDKKYSLKKQDIIEKPDRFVEALQAIFGSGAATIEKLIIQSICATTGLNPNTLNPPTLSDCIKQAEKALRTKEKARS